MLRFVLIALALFSAVSYAQDPNLHIYLAFGQSNMQGIGPFIDSDFETNPRFLVLRAANFSDQKVGEFYPAKPPMGNSQSLMGITDFFGRKMIKELPDSITVAIANISIGGQSIDLFDKDYNTAYVAKMKSIQPTWWWIPLLNEYGGDVHKRIVEMGEIAKKKGVIKGFLFHQGEADYDKLDWPLRVRKVYTDLIYELQLDASKTPILIGELAPTGDFGWRNTSVKVAANIIPNGHLISAEGCSVQTEIDPVTHEVFKLHYTREGYKILGERYADKMLELLREQAIDDSLEALYHKEFVKPKLYYDAKNNVVIIHLKKHGKEYNYQITGRRKNK